MTAEVALLNTHAVAMAADSTITMRGASPTTTKTFHSANKIFCISDGAAVGVMYYQNVDFMGTPWETIVKLYRRHSRDVKFDTVHEHACHFLRYLTIADYLNSEGARRRYARRTLAFACVGLGERMPKDAPPTSQTLFATANKYYQDLLAMTKAHDLEGAFAVDGFLKRLESSYAQEIADALQSFGISKPSKSLLAVWKKIAAIHLGTPSTNGPFLAGSGIVFAGFGEAQVFPELVAYEVEGVPLTGHLVHKRNHKHIIDFDEARAFPFAQTDVATNFLLGMDQPLSDDIRSCVIETAVKSAVDSIANLRIAFEGDSGFPGLPPGTFEEITTRVAARAAEMGRQAAQGVTDKLVERHLNPFFDVLKHLQKDEIAEVAETLLHMTKLKRRLSSGPETVGGPIDVAVITKGDGFIWTKRKHYFPSALNLQYFRSMIKNDLAPARRQE